VTGAGSPGLRREVGLLGLTAIAVNGVVGSGIFVLPATVAGLLGPASPLAYLVAALVTALVVLCFAEAGSRFEETGGPYLYARVAFGDFPGFVVGWMFLLSRLAAAGAIANAFVAYLAYFHPAVAGPAGRLAAITLLLGGLAAVNVTGVRHGSRVVNVFTIAKLLPLLLLIAVGLASGRFAPLGAPPSLASLQRASLLLIFAFGGFENANVPTEEVREPRRHLPVALVTAILLSAALYVSIQVVAQAAVPGLAGEGAPLAAAGRALLGAGGAAVVTLGAVLSTSGSVSAIALVAPRLLYAFARAGQMPAPLGRVHPRYRTPHVAVVVTAFLVWSVAVLGSFALLAAVSAIARLTFSAATCLAVPVLRRKAAGRPPAFTVPGGDVVPVLAVLLSSWLLAGIPLDQARAGAVALLVGVALFFAGRVGATSG